MCKILMKTIRDMKYVYIYQVKNQEFIKQDIYYDPFKNTYMNYVHLYVHICLYI